jgi:hypothetical protein
MYDGLTGPSLLLFYFIFFLFRISAKVALHLGIKDSNDS